MNPSHLAAIMTAAILGGASASSFSPQFQPRLEYDITYEPQSSPIMPGRSRRKPKAPLNQRQRRKDRRRAHAAGKRNAFA